MSSSDDKEYQGDRGFIQDLLLDSALKLKDPDVELNLSDLHVKELGEDFPLTGSDEEPNITLPLQSPQHFGGGDFVIQEIPKAQTELEKIYLPSGSRTTKRNPSPIKPTSKKRNDDPPSDEDIPPPHPTHPPRDKPLIGSKSRYQDYIYSHNFAQDSVKKTLEKCSKYSADEPEVVHDFWKTNIVFMLKLIEDGHFAAAHRVKIHIRDGFEKLNTFLEGMLIGVSVGKSSVKTKVIEDLGGLAESMSKTNSRLIKEYQAHQQQAKEFIQQVSASSKVVADFQHAVEQVKLATLKLQLIPGPPGASGLVPSIPSLDSRDYMVDESVIGPEKIEYIEFDGTYRSHLGTLKIVDGKITSWEPLLPEFDHFRILVGNHVAYAKLICNLNLVDIAQRMKQDPQWLIDCFPGRGQIDKARLTMALRGLKKTTHQWTLI